MRKNVQKNTWLLTYFKEITLIITFSANDDQQAATDEKTALEEIQRAAARDRKATGIEHQSRFFEQDGNAYLYKHPDSRYYPK